MGWQCHHQRKCDRDIGGPLAERFGIILNRVPISDTADAGITCGGSIDLSKSSRSQPSIDGSARRAETFRCAATLKRSTHEGQVGERPHHGEPERRPARNRFESCTDQGP